MDEETLGTDRLQAMADHFGGVLEDPGHADLHTLHNSDSATCAITSATFTAAESAPSHMAIHPITPSLKFPQNFLSDLESGELDDIGGVRLVLCPKVEPTAALSSLSSLLESPPSSSDILPSCLSTLSSLTLSPSSRGKPYIFVEAIDQTLEAGCLQDTLALMATLPSVCSLEPSLPVKALNREAAWITQSANCKTRSNKECSNTPWLPSSSDKLDSAKSTPFWDAGITGRGQILQISDTGLDIDNQYFLDDDTSCSSGFSKDKTGSSNLQCRKVVQYFAYVDTTDDENGHGTHVVGSVLGHRSSTGGDTPNDSWDDSNGLAKDARVAFFDIGQTGYDGLSTPPDLATMFDASYGIGARIHSASWGRSTNYITSNDMDIDDYMYDNDDYLVLVAAGNSGDGDGAQTWNKPNTVGSPACAKNILSVGATQSGPTGTGPYLTSGSKVDAGYEYLASFSSRGPTQDGRIKPDIVAPGYFIKSAGARMGSSGGSETTYMAGTSMATPVAAGVAALVRDYFIQGFYPTGSKVPSNSMVPSGALVKAVMINGAKPLAGIQNDDSSGSITSSSEYDFNQGFGRIQLNGALPIVGNNDIKVFVVDGVSLTQAQSEVYTFKIDTSSCSSNELVMTLVWTDPATTGSWRCINNCVYNDLDLKVTKSSSQSTIYPNGKSGRDSTDNVERVRTTVSDGETVTATVTARSIGMNTRQKFAFVASGCIGEEDDEVVIGTNAPTTSPTPS
eukprot:CAMPEP_0118652038 /NCGR_PEP_ID=MMETSP0785-20121206/11102_1 /TAXON_ID=91992 /ORGANISM="Bolidomonas pacifica, Strain CCMP 1866" /LENGTH=734 /DNA_ID=CAMNT_0006544523 /DNA_START=252 /DNA_END=2452 /DNA_ORIENTATION=+